MHQTHANHAVQAVVVGEECARAKPFPDPYLDAAKLLGLGIDEVFAIEDSTSGLLAFLQLGASEGVIRHLGAERALAGVACTPC